MDSEGSRVTVSVRVRPKLAFAANTLQQSERYEEVICIPTSDTSLHLAERRAAKTSHNMHFAYDHVFDADATQEEVYETAALDSVDSVMSGTSASILAYGQTGSGKTFTVLGKTARRTEGGDATEVVGPDSGLLLRAIQDMLAFAERMRVKKERHVVLGITAIEVYNDEVRDLLREGGASVAPLQPIMTRDALHFPGLTHMPLCTLRDACDIYQRAAARRVQRATSANDASSRSHAIFTVEVFQTPISLKWACPPTLAECCALRGAQVTTQGWFTARPPARRECFEGAPNLLLSDNDLPPIMYSALTVADLAGSEKAKHADVRGTGFDEMRRINASLTALGNVVHHLYHNSAHIPYRDSKLTMVLRDTFAAPRSRVVLMVNVSPTAITCEETLSSLYFANKMKGIKAPDTAASPQQAALQTGYLASLRVHDALLAEVHIFHAQQELDTGLLQRAASTMPDHPLLQLPFHTVLGEGPNRADRLWQLSDRLKAGAGVSASPEARMHRFAEAARCGLMKEFVNQYNQRCAEVLVHTAEVERGNEAIKKELVDMEASMGQSLRAVKAETQKAAATRRELSKLKVAQKAQLAALSNVLASSSKDNGHDNYGDATMEDPEGAPGDKRKCESPGDAAEAAYRKALAAAELRHTFVELVAFNVRTEPAPATLSDDISCSGATPHTEKSRSCSGTTASTPTHCGKHRSVEEWLRGAVLAMAGNAVVQSTRRKAKEQGASCRPALGDVTNHLPAAPSQKRTRQLPKFWKVLQQLDEQPRTANNAPPREGDATVAAEAARGVRCFSSPFDDPELFTRVTAYMDMGASLMKVDRNGSPQPRWFYLAQRGDRLVLCWDGSRRGASLSGGGHAYLDAVKKIILGRSSPGFLKYANVAASGMHKRKPDAAEAEECCSFTVVYQPHSKYRDLKFVDVICPSQSEMETWVVGLAHWSGVSPLFEDSLQPGGAAVGEAEKTESSPVTAGLDAQEALLSRLWHIPAAVLVSTRQEIEGRRSRHHSGKMRLTPGVLRDLTGLDIFRASALWRHFAKEGWVASPTIETCCFVGSEKPS
ncbi:putative kinesin [Leptomonas seymouri]|uniref:Putative kinesin n=1 Tax=Leptomonas seymouri TaxID=5684 RepID=A0A0N0P672_LEPSE|nr:putative kinesin [Leptomonas seymouri]|eukprot:KPI86827.1 putative kinesin [Leptomonas seymouri]